MDVLWHELLKNKREERSYSQEEVAEAIGVDVKTVSRWERGESAPYPVHRRKLAELFAVSIDELRIPKKSRHIPYVDNVSAISSTTEEALLAKNRNMEDEKNDKRFTGILEELREARGIGKKDMASLAGISPAYISFLISETRTTPSEKVVHALAEALKLSTEERVRLFTAAGYSASISSLFTGKSPDENSRQDWGEVPHISMFCGREKEVEQLREWIVDDHCQVVALIGMGGTGKTALATYVAEKIVSTDFDFILWRSLQHAPHIEKILQEAIYLFSERKQEASLALEALKDDIDGQIALLIDYLQAYRCLLVLDNFESVLEGKDRIGNYREGYEKYGKLLERIGEVKHRSCLLLTGREKPREMQGMVGKNSHMHLIFLGGIAKEDARLILAEKELQGTDKEWEAFIALYSGNPLALKLVADSIQALFDGALGAFLSTGETVFGGIHHLLDKQFSRLSPLESTIMYWLAIERQEISLSELEQNLAYLVLKRDLFEAVEALLRRSMVEVHKGALFTLQPVIMEYVTSRLVKHILKEIDTEKIELLNSHALIKAQAKDYIRDIQVRLILEPIAAQLLDKMELKLSECEIKLNKLLSMLREPSPQIAGYAAGNILNLLIQLNINLQGYDFSYLTVWQAYLQKVTLRDVNFSHSDLAKSVFADNFSSVFSVTLSSDGKLLAAGTANGEVRIWDIASTTTIYTLQGHTEWIRSIAFSPSGNMLASGSEDQTIRLWNVSTGDCIGILQGHSSRVYSVAFSPDERIIVSGSDDKTIRLWNASTNGCFKVLQGHKSMVYSVAFNPDSNIVASGSDDKTIRLWDISSGECIKILRGHTETIRSVDFSSDGLHLVSGSKDKTIRLWRVDTGSCVRVLLGHTERIWSTIFNHDGSTVISGSNDKTIRIWDINTGNCLRIIETHGSRVYSVSISDMDSIIASGNDGQIVQLWDANTGECLKTLQGHGNRVYSLAYGPKDNILASGGEDKIVRLWDTHTGICLREQFGHTHWVWSVAFNSNGTILASGGEDTLVQLWNVNTGAKIKTLLGHENRVFTVTFSPDGNIIASSSGDKTIKLWDVSTGKCLKTLQGHNGRVYCVAFSSDGENLVSSSDDQAIKVWHAETGACLKTIEGLTNRVRSVKFSPDGRLIVGGDDKVVKVWVANSGECLITMQGHFKGVRSVVVSSDNSIIVSGGEDKEIRIWDINTGSCLKKIEEHNGAVYSVAFSPDNRTVAGSSDDGTIKIWDVSTEECLYTLRSSRPYEHMNITNLRGLNSARKATLKALGAIDGNNS